VVATKPMATQRDLSLAYSPGVAVPVLAIAKDESLAFDYTTKGNFVAVITNGTAILGLGNLGALAAKPVMEGKAVLFKRFADIDSIDLEVSSEDPTEIINCVKLLGKGWGGINLEDIKAPECFIVEQRLRELLDIPVFHDDQHAPPSSPRRLSTHCFTGPKSPPGSFVPRAPRHRLSRAAARSAFARERSVRTKASSEGTPRA
jgi:malate dehydrogenase (oxaloacetate-decarboxylating)(NADP+)